MNLFSRSKVSNITSNIRFKQVTSLFSVNLIGIPLGMVTSILITRYLGPQVYGDYKFIHNLINLAVIIGTFGILQAGNRAIIVSDNIEEIKELYGAELVFCLGLFIVIFISLSTYVFFDPNIHSKGLNVTIFLIIPFSWVYILVKYFEVLFQADNRIWLLIRTRFYPKLIFAFLIAIVYFLFSRFSSDKLLLVYFCFLFSQIIVFGYILWKLKPSFKNLTERLKQVWNYNKSYGFHVYLGSLFAVGSAQFASILISYFGNDNSGVGFYSLALTIAAPLAFIPNTVATSHYKEFAKMPAIPKRLFVFTLAISLFSLVLSWILISPFISFFYGNEFSQVISLFQIVSIGMIFHGFADFFNRFLGAHGKGKMLRNSSLVTGFSLFLFSIILIPIFGETGAAYIKSITGLIYIVTMIFFYYRYIGTKSSRRFI